MLAKFNLAGTGVFPGSTREREKRTKNQVVILTRLQKSIFVAPGLILRRHRRDACATD
jgi:hypothetical protein